MPTELRSLHAGAAAAAVRCCTLVLHFASSERIPFDRRGAAGMVNFKMYLLRPFCSNLVDFYNTQETQTQKMMDQNFEIRIL